MHKTPEPVKVTAPSIDDLINGIEPKINDSEIEKTTSDDDTDNRNDDTIDTSNNLDTEKDHEQESKEKRNANEEKREEVKQELSSSHDLDDYGNEIPKARTYTAEEVNQMMRERLSRGSYAQQTHPQTQATPQQIQQAAEQQVQQAAEGFIPNTNSTDSWEVQLDQYIDRRLEQREKSQKTKEWQQHENEKQIEFQIKFTTGMEKYKDFREVTGQLPITDSMMLATRDMKDPAAFIYAAGKQHPEEVKRIASLSDPFQQASEVGRLEERMRKSRNVTKAAAPLRNMTSDVSEKVTPKVSIDNIISSHAKRKAGRR